MDRQNPTAESQYVNLSYLGLKGLKDLKPLKTPWASIIPVNPLWLSHPGHPDLLANIVK
ncbi:hypothetical protein E4U36_006731, partial [Claviceps purpurea]